ncbi:MAG TPA: hypothetical protein VL307_15565, partial [Chitinophagaceae bacterium]|nr:hypothetical protein [Chitinophagaceae bacterium]
KHLQSALTNANGYFSIRLKNADGIALTVSKAYYEDTTVYIANPAEQQVQIPVISAKIAAQPLAVSPITPGAPGDIALNTQWSNYNAPFFFAGTSAQVERTMMGRLLLPHARKYRVSTCVNFLPTVPCRYRSPLDLAHRAN